MKLTYLGTAAAEGFPALFCNCKYCVEARRLGGKNIRTRSQSLVNDDLLIDLPADTYSHFLNNGIEGDRIKTLLITHCHSDHFYPKDLLMRHGAYAHDMRSPTLKLVASAGTLSVMPDVPPSVEVVTVKAYETVEVNGYMITALPARHMLGSEALFYIVKGDKTLLYAHDTGYFYDEVFEYLKNSGVKVDMISIDCTYVDIPVPDNEGHMGFSNIGKLIDDLKGIGAVTDTTVCYVNHFSHNGNPEHERLTALAAECGCGASYDGCCVEF